MAVSGTETLSYETVAGIRNSINTIKEDIRTQLETAKSIIAACETEGIFVTDKGSASMQEQFAQLAASFEPFITKLGNYADFLTNELNTTYSSTDDALANVWKNVADTFNSASK